MQVRVFQNLWQVKISKHRIPVRVSSGFKSFQQRSFNRSLLRTEGYDSVVRVTKMSSGLNIWNLPDGSHSQVSTKVPDDRACRNANLLQ
jgi:hypothetical protein